MLRLRMLALAACGVMLGALWVHAQESDVKEVIKKAIAAEGGEKLLRKYQAGTAKIKGTMELMGAMVKISGESTVQKPDKLKHVLTLEIMDKELQITQVYDGKKMWRSFMGQTMEVDDEESLEEMRQALRVESAAGLVDLLDKSYTLDAIGEVKVKDKAAVGVRVNKKGQREISLFFDKKTHLLVKTEMRVREMGQERTQEKFFSNYKDRNGLMYPSRLVIHKDGKLFMDLEITESQPLEKVDDATFAMP